MSDDESDPNGPSDPVELSTSPDDTGGVDAGWGEDTGSGSTDTTSREATSGTTASTSRSAPEEEPGSATPDHETVEDLFDSVPSDLTTVLDDATVPGQYEGQPYFYQRVGKSTTSWDRNREVRVSVFDALGQQIDDVHEYVNEVVYPETNVLKADVMMAALMVGIYNLEQLEAVLDLWGYE
jgi:hypothetical protein